MRTLLLRGCVVICVGALLLAACEPVPVVTPSTSTPAPVPTATPTPTQVLTPTETPEPTNTLTPTPSVRIVIPEEAPQEQAAYLLGLLDQHDYTALAPGLSELPEMQTIEDADVEALEDIVNLALNATSPEVREAFELMVTEGNPGAAERHRLSRLEATLGQIFVDGNRDDWELVPTLATDPRGDNDLDLPGTDPESVRAAIGNDFLYVMLELHGGPVTEDELNIDFPLNIDLTGDGNPDAMPNIWATGQGWIFYRNEYAAWQNVNLPSDHIAIGEVVEIKIPLWALDNVNMLVMAPQVWLEQKHTSADTFFAQNLVVSGGSLFPPHNTALQALLELAKRVEFKPDDTTALAIALANGIWRAYGDESVQAKVAEDDALMLDLAREIADWQAEQGQVTLEELPLEAKICWAWRGSETMYWGPFALSKMIPGEVELNVYEWNTVSIDALREIRQLSVQEGWVEPDINQTIANLEYCFYFNAAGNWGTGSTHWQYTNVEVTGGEASDVEIDGISVRPWSYFNADFSIDHYLQHGVVFGDCGDEVALIDAFAKSMGIATTALWRNERRLPEGAWDFPHVYTIYFDPVSRSWSAYPRQLFGHGGRTVFAHVFKPPCRQSVAPGGGAVHIFETTYQDLENRLTNGIPQREAKEWLLR